MNITKYQKVFGVGPLAALIGLVILGPLWFLDRALNHLEILSRPKPIRTIGFVLIVSWICWHSWCMKTIALWWRHDRLCTTGPYRLVRHPIYAGAALFFAAGISLMSNSWILLLLPGFLLVTYSILVRKEEAMMTAVFGEEYQHYAAKTGRFFPRIFS